jgi:regulator of protease activity HflC (stomatin/prohibitin superfamily)
MADRILQEVGGPDDYAGKVFLTPANTALKESTPAYTAQEIIAKRDEIGLATEAALDDRMAEYHIVIDRVSVSNVGLDAEFLASVEKKQIAQQDLARADFEAQTTEKHAEGEANAAIQRATGEAEAIRVRAIAQAEANDKLNDSLTPNVIQWQSIQRLSDKVRIMLVPADDNLILDIGDPLASPQP